MNSRLAGPPFIPENANAPFSREQIAWLNGFLAGMYSDAGASEAASSEGEASSAPLTILWGSQTGNSEGLARQASKRLQAFGYRPTVYDMSEYERSRLAQEENLVVITSTYGDGEPPDNASALYEWLMSDQAPKLEKLRYSVLALGDSNYPEFCKCGIEFDDRLRGLGATPLVPRVECDLDFEESFDEWLAKLGEAVKATLNGASHSPRIELRGSTEADAESAPTASGKKIPFAAKLLRNVNLNAPGSSKETRHIEFSLAGSGLSYQPGDALAVMPENEPGYVRDFLAAVRFSGDEPVAMKDGSEGTLKEALQFEYDVTSLTLKVAKAYAERSGNAELLALVRDKEGFGNYAWGRQLLDLLAEYPSSFSNAEDLLGLLGKLSPRLYSISSSPLAHPEEVHVTVRRVQYEARGRRREGVCSGYLARKEEGAEARVYLHPSNTFRLPADGSVPVIMVGPGTGIAPFRAFLEERAAVGAEGKNWLFFGDQRESFDFLYREELEAYLRSGCLTRLSAAFSRDQERKVYVQDRMVEHGEELFRWLEDGAYFYVCGDASRMAKDVDAALKRIVQGSGGKSEEEASSYVEAMKRDKRYLRDVY